MVNWHSLSKKELLQRFSCTETGLSTEEAKKRLLEYGENSITLEKKTSLLHLLIEQFTSPLVLMLLGAAILSFFLGKVVDGALITTILIFNGIFGFLQEYNAEKSLEALKKMSVAKALVYRNNSLIKISSEKIVPGDIILLSEGTKICADARIIESSEIEVDESILTGESNPVDKITDLLPEKTLLADRLNMLFMNTMIVKGKAKAIVVATGKATQVGKIAEQLQDIEEEPTRFNRELADLTKKISAAVLVLVIIIAITLFFIQNSNLLDVVMTAISLAVAAIPEGLPAVVTLSFAIATKKMLKNKSLVRKLSVIETLGSVDIICTDKTGTLTENSMTVQEMFCNNQKINLTGTGQETEGKFFSEGKEIDLKKIEKLLLCGFACNDTIVEKNSEKINFIGDPTEIALTVSAMKAKINLKGMKRIKDYVFTSTRKRMTTVYEQNGKTFAFSKGASEILIKSCSHVLVNGKIKVFTKIDMQKAIDINNEMASKALRVLGFAYKELNKKTDSVEKDMIFLGLQGMLDPPRKDVRNALETAKLAGIRVLMLTGDNKITAEAIAKQIGFTGKQIDASEFEKLSKQEFEKKIEECDVFSRVSPEQKLSILKYLKEKGHSVAMTGDGVNDAPALKQADVGISMGLRGSDVAKEASDIILLDDNFSTIISAIKQGRTIFDNIQKFVTYLLSSNLAEVLIVFISAIIGIFVSPNMSLLAITPIQILWINLLTDGMPALALGADPPKPGIMTQAPRKADSGIITPALAKIILITGLILTVILIAIFLLYLPKGILIAQTMVFTSLIIYEFVRIVVIRQDEDLGFFSNKILILALVISIGLQLLLLYNPIESIIPLSTWFGVVSLSLSDWGVIAIGGIIAYVSSISLTKLANKPIVTN